MIKVVCYACEEELEEPGGLAFGPPSPDGTTVKFHICVTCWDTVFIPTFVFRLSLKEQLQKERLQGP